MRHAPLRDVFLRRGLSDRLQTDCSRCRRRIELALSTEAVWKRYARRSFRGEPVFDA
jgi:hypothetical protein